jgi:hypothetical protein
MAKSQIPKYRKSPLSNNRRRQVQFTSGKVKDASAFAKFKKFATPEGR